MIAVIDSNIILDVLLKREPFFTYSVEVLRLAEKSRVDCYLTANSITDILYILRKYISDYKDRETAIKNIMQIVEVVSITKRDILKAFEFGLNDYEDALQTQCARKIKADYIVTRNKQDFINIGVEVVTAEEFVEVAKGI
jgi:predicted nucleic acid-binding protein